MVHVLDLLGCVAVGPTTEEALATTPDAIRAYRRLLHRHGEPVDPEEPFETRVVEHITEGRWLGNGSPYILFRPDTQPLTETDMDLLLPRLAASNEELSLWVASQSDAALDASSAAGGRSARAILLHVIGARGAILSLARGNAPGFSRLRSAAERGEIALPVALDESRDMVAASIRSTSPNQRRDTRLLSSGPKTLRQAMRRLLEHDWEHLTELSRRAGGPPL
jgi:predicted RNase H-like HicB family nuclease